MLFFIALLVTVPLLIDLYLIREWLWRKEGVDLDQEAVEIQGLHQRLSAKQLVTMVMLAAPAVIFLVAMLLYVLASVVLYVVGAA